MDQRVNLGIGTVAIWCNCFYSFIYSFSRKSHKSDFKFQNPVTVLCPHSSRLHRQLETYLIVWYLWLSKSNNSWCVPSYWGPLCQLRGSLGLCGSYFIHKIFYFYFFCLTIIATTTWAASFLKCLPSWVSLLLQCHALYFLGLNCGSGDWGPALLNSSPYSCIFFYYILLSGYNILHG